MIRLALIILIVILITRIFILYSGVDNDKKEKMSSASSDKKGQKGVPKGIGEYVDYEEIKK
jgi:hypothetical protein